MPRFTFIYHHIPHVLLSLVCHFGFGSLRGPITNAWIISCNDPTINLPYKDSTVSSIKLMLTCFGVPPVIIAVISALKRKKWWLEAHFYCLKFLTGAVLTIFITELLKYTIGRPRPHFLPVCMPRECNSTQLLFGGSYTCTNDTPADDHVMKNLRLSFPSGHSSLAAYTATFLIVYLQVRQRQVISFVIQILLFTWALLIAVSRIADHKHHKEDVIAGCMIGTSIAIIVWRYCANALTSCEHPAISFRCAKCMANFDGMVVVTSASAGAVEGPAVQKK